MSSSVSSFNILADTELWDYQFTQYTNQTQSNCQNLCIASPLCVGYKFYPSSFSDTKLKSTCSLFYWIAENTKTAMPGAISAIRNDAAVRDKFCYKGYVLSDVGCSYDFSQIQYNTLDLAIDACNKQNTCIAVEVDQKFITETSIPKTTDAKCITFMQTQRGIMVTYFLKNGDTTKCNKYCGIGDNYLKVCTKTQNLTSTRGIDSPPIVKEDNNFVGPLIAGILVLLGIILLIGIVVCIKQRIKARKGLNRLGSNIITTPTMENQKNKRQGYSFDT
eukprot:NODE_144_length_15804_cov_0.729131.p9 type:complete len:276 gc:universal NODE_144_length_15804_cov_0.729131:14749-13922(-)